MQKRAPSRPERPDDDGETDAKSLLERSKLLELRAIKAEDERDLISTLLVSRCNDIEAKHLTLITELREKLEDLEAEKYFLSQQFQERIASMESDRQALIEKLRQQLADVETDRDDILAKFREKCKELDTMATLYSQEAVEEKIKEIERSKDRSLRQYQKHLKSVEADRDYLINDLTKRFDKANQDLAYLIELIEKLLALHQIRLAETENQRDMLISKLKKRLDENKSLNDRMESLKALLATHGDASFLGLSKGASDAEFIKSLQGSDFPTIHTLSASSKMEQDSKLTLRLKNRSSLKPKEKEKASRRGKSKAKLMDEYQSLTYTSPPEITVLETGAKSSVFDLPELNYLYLLAYNG